jgi:hypothetical protein
MQKHENEYNNVTEQLDHQAAASNAHGTEENEA